MSLTQDHVRAHFDYDPEGHLIWRHSRKGTVAGQRAGCVLGSGYVQVQWFYEKYLAHRLIWLWHHGTLPNCLDHIDRDPGNNRIENLREASSTQNSGNRRKQGASGTTSSKWRGVHWCNTTRAWIATLQVKGRAPYVGRFKHEADAALAYNFAAAEYYGEFANLNSAEQTGIP